jgi:hypothetical protein
LEHKNGFETKFCHQINVILHLEKVKYLGESLSGGLAADGLASGLLGTGHFA